MIAGIVLAAGLGERFGGAKLARELDGRPLVCQTLQYCFESALDAVVVVVGPAGDPLEAIIRSAFADESRLSFVHNSDPARGQMSSVKAGLRALPAGVQGAVICLGDMPFVGADIVNRLVETHRRTGGFVVPECEGVWRNPRVIPAAHFADFLSLGDNEKGAAVFERFRPEVQVVTTGDARHFADIDTVEDLKHAEQIHPPDGPQ